MSLYTMSDPKHESVYPCGNWTKTERVGDTWVKKTTIVKPEVLDSILYFSTLSDFLPDILSYEYEDDVLTIVTRHVEGKRLDTCDIHILLECYGDIYRDFLSVLHSFPNREWLHGNSNKFFCTDIKPSNFILGKDGNLYFVDMDAFELASDIKMTQALYRMSATFTHLISERMYDNK